MPASLIYHPVLTFRDQNDVPIPFARVHSYLAGTTTPSSLFTSATGLVAHPNPAICSLGGTLTAYGIIGLAYKLDVKFSDGSQAPGFPIDNLVITPAGDPSLIAGMNLTQLQTTVDPGEVGTENLPDSLQEWQYQVQFKLEEISGTNQWYESHNAALVLHNLRVVLLLATDIANLFPPTGTTTQYHTFRLPAGWKPQTDLTWVFDRKTTSGAGTAIMNYSINRERPGQAAANIVTTTAINFAPGNGNLQRASVTIPGSGLLDADDITITLQRLGDDAGDTDAGNIYIMSSDVVYTGLPGR